MVLTSAIYFIVSISFVVISTTVSDLCDDISFLYRIANNVTLLDIAAESISNIRHDCYKNIRLDGAVDVTLHVEDAAFGSNTYFEYGDVGIEQRLAPDKMFVYPVRCANAKSEAVVAWRQEIHTGLVYMFNSSDLCILFQPETYHNVLDTHVRGGRIKISLVINVGYCNPHSGETPKRRYVAADATNACRPLCSAQGVIHECLSTTDSKADSTASQQELTAGYGTISTIMNLVTAWNTSLKTIDPVTMFTTSSTIMTSAKSLSHTSVKSTFPTYSNTSQTRSQFSNKINGTTSTTSTATSTTSSTESLTTSQQGKIAYASTGPLRPTQYRRTTFRQASSITEGANIMTRPTIRDLVTTSPENTAFENMSVEAVIHANTITSQSYAVVSTTQMDVDEGTIFGLLEGLYILAGCIFLLLVISAVACCVYHRLHREFTPCGADRNKGLPRPSTSVTGMSDNWRDNWLVRYHGDDNLNDSLSQSGSDINFIHENFINKSDSELNLIQKNVYRYQCCHDPRNENEENHYDNPWPLVQLDSDFVKTAKSLESVHSNDESSDVVDSSANISSSLTENMKQLTYNVEIKVKPESEKVHYRKRVGSHYSRGRYSLVKARRNSSKCEKKMSPKTSETYRTIRNDICNENVLSTKLDHSDMNTKSDTEHGSELAKVNRERRSPMHSDCNITFNEMIQDEIDQIESVFDTEDIVDLDVIGNATLETSDKRELKVSTMYAVVSPKDGTTQNGITSRGGASGTIQFPK